MEKDSRAELKIAALSNPLSGRNKRGAFAKFKKLITKFSGIEHIAVSSPQEITRGLEQFKCANIDIIVVNGGDGTLQTVLTYLKKKENLDYSPELVLLPAGTTSMAYGDVGYRGNVENLLLRITASRGNVKGFTRLHRPVLRMNIAGMEKSICGMFFGAGAIYSGILYCRQKLHTKGVRGEIGPSIAMLRFLFDWVTVNKLTTPAVAKIIVNNSDPITGEFNVITATTLNRLLMGIYPFWAKGDRSSTFAITMIKRNPPKPRQAFINILRGRPPGVEEQQTHYYSYIPESVRIKIDNGFTLDGELFGQQGKVSNIELSCAGKVKFLVK